MAANRFRAWRFVHPDFDVAEGPSGLGVSSRGGMAMIDDDQSIRQSLLLLLTTYPGERVMLPGYGCSLHELAFAPNDDTTAGLAIHYVRRAVSRWEPRVEILKVDATRTQEDEGRLDILLEYRVRSTLTQQQLRLPVNLMHPDI
jgi:phage baseplate assembly protein W